MKSETTKSRSASMNHITHSFAALAIAAILTPGGRAASAEGPTETRFVEGYGRLPLYFVENQGQTDPAVDYVVNGRGTTLHFTAEGIRFTAAFADTNTAAARLFKGRRMLAAFGETAPQPKRWWRGLDFIGGRPGVKAVAEEPAAAVVSYFKGPPEQWKTGLRTYTRLVYRDVWPGIDVEFSGTGNRLNSRFVLKPGADPRKIRLRHQGIRGVRKGVSGKLDASTQDGVFHEEEPVAFQRINGRRVPVAVDFFMESSAGAGAPDQATAASIGFEVGAFDAGQTLTIDGAVFLYNNVIGGSREERGLGLAVDVAGNTYVCGYTGSSEATFPGTVGPDLTINGGQDAFVLKLDPTGSQLIYAGYIGGSGTDHAFCIDVAPDGSAYVAGATTSSEASFPVRVGPDLTWNEGVFNPSSDVFVAKIAPDGTDLLYCGYIGGSGFEGAEGVALDEAGHLYVMGPTFSSESSFPVVVGPDLTHNGQIDTFIAKVRPDGSGLVYCGYIGGAGDDAWFVYLSASLAGVTGGGVAVDEEGAAYVVNFTTSRENTFPNGEGFASLGIPGPDQTYNGGPHDAFIAKVRPDGTGLTYCGYIGGADQDGAYGVGVDSAHNAYLAGQTSSSEATFPVLGGPDLHYHGGTDLALDGFVAKVRADGTGLIYCGYIGSPLDDLVANLRVDQNGNAYLVGETESDETSFPVTNGPDLTFNGARDAFAAKVKANPTDPVVTNNYDFCTYIGLAGEDAGFDIGVDGAGDVSVCGDLAAGALVYGGAFESDSFFVVKIRSGPGLEGAPYLDHFAWGPIAPTQTVNVPFPVTITAQDAANHIATDFVGRVSLAGLGPRGISFRDDFEDGSISDWQPGLAEYTRAVTTETAAVGSYSLTLIGGACHFNGLSRALPNLRPDRITFHVRASSATADGAHLVIGTGIGESQIAAAVSMTDGAIARGAYGPGFFPYLPDRWYRVTLALDWIRKEVKYYVDDTPISASFPFIGSGVDRLSVMHLFNASDTQVWYDELEFLQPGESWPVAISPTSSVNFTNGVWGGLVTVQELAEDMTLGADDHLGHTGLANAFVVEGTMVAEPPPGPLPALAASVPFNPVQATPGGLELNVASTWPGFNLAPASTVAVVDNRAYVGVGPELVILDVSDPTHPQFLGSLTTAASPIYSIDFIQDITISGTHAFLAKFDLGLLVVDISDAANPRLVGGLDTPGFALDVALAGDLAYVADGLEGLQVIDISSPANPRQVGGFAAITNEYVRSVAVTGDVAYAAHGRAGLLVIDISNPANPQLIDTYHTATRAFQVEVAGAYAYVIFRPDSQTRQGDLYAFDITDPVNPRLRDTYHFTEAPTDVAFSGNYAFVALFPYYGVTVLDVSDPADLRRVGSRDTPGNANAIAIQDNFGYVADGSAGLQVLNLSNLASPQLAGAHGTDGDIYDVAVAGNYAYLADASLGDGDHGLRVFDVSDPFNLQQVGHFDDLSGLDAIRSIAVSGSHAFATIGDRGLAVYDVSDPTAPSRAGGIDTGSSGSVMVSGNYAYVAETYSQELNIVDIGDPTNPQPLGTWTDGFVAGMTVSGSYLYVAAECDGLMVVDISDPANPRSVGGLGPAVSARAVAVQGLYGYLGDGFGISVLDVSAPSDPIPVGRLNLPGEGTYVTDLTVSGTYVFAAAGSSGVYLVDVSNPASPRYVASYDTRGNAQAVAVLGNFGYVADRSGGLSVVDLSCFLGEAVCIGRSPHDQTVAVGWPAQFDVAAFGTGPLSYQWFKEGMPLVDGGPVSGATTPTLVLTNVQFSDAGAYAVVIGNAVSTATSQVAQLTVVAGFPPDIVQEPPPQTNEVGRSASFEVLVSGTEPLSFRWFKNGLAVMDDGRITGAASSILEINNVQFSDAGAYTLVGSNTFGVVTSQVAQLTVVAFPPEIAEQPESQAVVVGVPGVSLEVSATGTDPLSYQWQKDGVPLTDNGSVSGSASRSLSLANLQLSDTGDYRVVVTNGFGSVTSSVATLTVTEPPTQIVNGSFETGDFFGWIVSDTSRPLQALQVRPDGYSPGDSFFSTMATDGSFSATHGFEGFEPGTIRLAQDTAIVSGAEILSFDYRAAWWNVSATQQRLFNVVIEPVGGGTPLLTTNFLRAVPATRNNDSGPLTGTLDLSAFVGVTVRIGFDAILPEGLVGHAFFQLDNVALSSMTEPQIVQQPQSQSIEVGRTATFSVIVTGMRPLRHIWAKDGLPLIDNGRISGVASSSLEIAELEFADAGAYTVVVSNTLGVVTSEVARLMVTGPVSSEVQVVNGIVQFEFGADLSVAASGHRYVIERKFRLEEATWSQLQKYSFWDLLFVDPPVQFSEPIGTNTSAFYRVRLEADSSPP